MKKYFLTLGVLLIMTLVTASLVWEYASAIRSNVCDGPNPSYKFHCEYKNEIIMLQKYFVEIFAYLFIPIGAGVWFIMAIWICYNYFWEHENKPK